jgi:hypothetical protein
VEEPVGERVRLEAGDGRLRVAALAGQHVVPLQDLVEDDAVDEAAEPDAEQDARDGHRRRRPRPRADGVGRHFLPSLAPAVP